MISTAITYRYWIDADDKIVFVNAPWLAFARENGAAELTEEFVVGRLLWDFIDGDETKQLYLALIRLVRTKNQRVIVPFRCDSPTLRREMRLVLLPNKEMVRFESVVTRVTPRDYLDLLDRRISRSFASLDICSFCKRVFVERYEWIEIDEAVAHLNLLEEQNVPRLRQTVCDVCARLT